MIINVYANMSSVYVDKLRGANHNKVISRVPWGGGMRRNSSKGTLTALKRAPVEPQVKV